MATFAVRSSVHRARHLACCSLAGKQRTQLCTGETLLRSCCSESLLATTLALLAVDRYSHARTHQHADLRALQAGAAGQHAILPTAAEQACTQTQPGCEARQDSGARRGRQGGQHINQGQTRDSQGQSLQSCEEFASQSSLLSSNQQSSRSSACDGYSGMCHSPSCSAVQFSDSIGLPTDEGIFGFKPFSVRA